MKNLIGTPVQQKLLIVDAETRETINELNEGDVLLCGRTLEQLRKMGAIKKGYWKLFESI